MTEIRTHRAPKRPRLLRWRFVAPLLAVPLIAGALPGSAAAQAPTVSTQPAAAARSVTLAAPKAPYPFRGWAGPWRNPHPGARVSSCFGKRTYLYQGEWRTDTHRGVDLVSGYGTAVRAAATGRVMAVGWVASGYGREVIIYHGGGVWTHMAHLSRTVVAKGQNVNVGAIVGYEGSSGQVTGSHLHLEIEHGNRTGRYNFRGQTDPAPFLAARGVRLGC